MELQRKEVDSVIEEKILRFAKERETFTTKELFEANPNIQEFLLRYALNNLRIDEKVFMFGNKRGAYYSTKKDCVKTGDQELDSEADNQSLNDLVNLVFAKASNFDGWFARPQIQIENVYPAQIIEALKKLEEAGKIEIQGKLRWTQYRVIDPNRIEEKVEKPVSSAKDQVLEFIKKNKVTTVPILIDKLELQRYAVVAALKELEEEEEIYHDGIKKSSKYIHKDVDYSEVEKLVSELCEQRLIPTVIDELSAFLEGHQNCAISMLQRGEKFVIRFINDGICLKEKDFPTLDEMIAAVYKMTEYANG